MPKVIHFELPFDDAERANRFYADVFGWQSEQFGDDQYYLQQTGGEDEAYGIGGALTERAATFNGGNTLIIIGVDDLDSYIGKVSDAGCEIVTPRTEIPGIGWFANFRDTEGNVVGMFMGND